MVKITKPQRKALARVHARVVRDTSQGYLPAPAPTYRAFRATVQPTFGCDGAVLVPLPGMWLGIEADGYTHS